MHPLRRLHEYLPGLSAQRRPELRRHLFRPDRPHHRSDFQRAKYSNLPYASTLNGSCTNVCPVKINIPKHLINLRRDITNQQLNSSLERFVYRTWARAMRSPMLYALICKLQAFDLRRRSKKTGWISRLPRIASGWKGFRMYPAAPARPPIQHLLCTSHIWLLCAPMTRVSIISQIQSN